jgi:NADPH2:quinone reductase
MAQMRNMPAKSVAKVPDGIGLDTAAAMTLKGMTVEYLFHRTFQFKPESVSFMPQPAVWV